VTDFQGNSPVNQKQNLNGLAEMEKNGVNYIGLLFFPLHY